MSDKEFIERYVRYKTPDGKSHKIKLRNSQIRFLEFLKQRRKHHDNNHTKL
jgi:hypothetical protein